MNNYNPISKESIHKTIFLADIPKNASYMDIVSYYEKNLKATPQVTIKR